MKKILFLALTSMAFAAKTVTPSVPTLDTDGCYAISTAEELFGFADIVNASETHDECGKLTEDVVINKFTGRGGSIQVDGDTVEWTPIKLFSGEFDGQHHTIKGLMRETTDSSDVGLFAEVRGNLSDSKDEAKSAVVKNLELTYTFFWGFGNCVGGVAGKVESAEILNVRTYNLNNVESRKNAGGLIGCASDVKVVESSSNAYVRTSSSDTNSASAGGLVGFSNGSLSIVNSANGGSVSGKNVGGMVGISTGKLTIVNSINLYANSGTFSTDPIRFLGKYNEVETHVDNCFYYGDSEHEGNPFATLAERDDLKKGVITMLLRDYNKDGVDGTVWGQSFGIANTTFPGLYGKMEIDYTDENYDILTLEAKAPALVDGCYQIGSAEELYGFVFIANMSSYKKIPVCGKLTKDIVVNKDILKNDTLNGNRFNRVPWIAIKNFDGTFDGAGHTISGLFFDNDPPNTTFSESYMGLFGSVLGHDSLREVKIENLGIEDSYLMSDNAAGALVGIVDIDHKGTLTIKNCHSSSYVGSFASGGLVGAHNGGNLVVEQSYVTGRVDGSASGGLVGNAYADIKVVNSYSVAGLESEKSGVLISSVGAKSKGYVVNSYGLDLAAKKMSREVYPLVGRVDDKSSVEYVNAFSEKTQSAESFSDGTVAVALHYYNADGVNGEVWGQNVGTDLYPVFSKTVPDSTGKTSIAVTLKASPIVVRSVNRMVEISGMPAGEGYALLDMQGRLLQRGYASGASVTLNVARPSRYLVRVAGQVKAVTIH
ncbi:MAG: hypothetical protein IK114_01415 [Fibrobacter sp.]|nr:hypothetical protein [Fibrobacter sp.]